MSKIVLHSRQAILATLLTAITIASMVSAPPCSAEPPRPAPIRFASDIQSVFRANCYQCHGPQQQQGGLRLNSRAVAFKGGVSGAVIIPGKSSESLLIARLSGEGGKPAMPLGFAPLSPEKIARIRAWIDGGAVWPAGADAKHWAYVTPVRPAIPHVRASSWPQNPIDSFILARLEKERLTPSPPAERETLLRRVSFDLIGLPPTVGEVDAFISDRSPNAYEKAVDRLLANPHFGERWARLWLDLARYADSNGYEKDARRTIWPYRDWVIDAFNQDMPFDQFTIDQLAGDMLPNASSDQKIATGFHRNTLYNEEGGVDRDEQRWLTIVDRVSTTASVWLGTTMACAQCHDHKYDPFTTNDYYRLFAFFDNCDEPTLTVHNPSLDARIKSLQDDIDAINGRIRAEGPVDPTLRAALEAEVSDRNRELADLKAASTLVMQERPGSTTPTTYIHVKGGFLAKTTLVSAGVPASLPALKSAEPVNRLALARWIVSDDNPLTARVAVNRLWEQVFGRGIVESSDDFGTQGSPPTHPELLDWLATELMHPTTTGPAKPWSLKHILRLIVTSSTYRQSSHVSPILRERDPGNRLLARGPRFRLEAEMIRDSALSAAGLLSPKIGGPSVFPVQPDGIWMVPYNGDTWNTNLGDDRYRRGIYTFWRRSAPYPEFISFDATSREYCTLRRIRTTTPLQALTTLNDPAFLDAARGLAARMSSVGKHADLPNAPLVDRMAFGFRCCTSRRPSAHDLALIVNLYKVQHTHFQTDLKAAQQLASGPPNVQTAAETAALTVVANVLLNLDESLTKE